VAAQSQDYQGAKWAIAQRTAGDVTDAELDAWFDTGAVLRIHVLRPTWHFVAAEDLRWLLALTAPRNHQASAYQYRQTGLDPDTRARGREVLRRALAGGRALTRVELRRALVSAGMGAAGVGAPALRMTYLVMDAELEAVICNGPRRGRQQTYALVDERIPPSRPRERDEALAELATRYVLGHGPAQAIDLAWWSGLTLGDARRGLEAAGAALRREEIDGRVYWVDPDEAQRASDAGGAGAPSGTTFHLLPNYDELLVAFADRSDAMDARLPAPARVAAEILAHVLVRDGLVIGRWRRREAGAGVGLELEPLVPLRPEERARVRAQIDRLRTFLGRPLLVAGLD
jgi:hypothetical protein